MKDQIINNMFITNGDVEKNADPNVGCSISWKDGCINITKKCFARLTKSLKNYRTVSEKVGKQWENTYTILVEGNPVNITSIG
ncbi:hypothetical protein JEZ13_04175 [bacterium]|nr:hypothetical protein [bacterium]MBI9072944.1 hypothetical protein [Melioribacteraceae bacterium]